MTSKRKPADPNASSPAAGPKRAAARPVPVSRRQVMFALGAVAAAGGGAALLIRPTEASAGEVVVYKDPACECCGRWASHMRQNGFSVVVNTSEDMDAIKREAGVPEAVASCHTAYVGGYVIEGHVPASDIKQLLATPAAVRGLAAPGMPASAPGMDLPEAEPYVVFAFDADGSVAVFASH